MPCDDEYTNLYISAFLLLSIHIFLTFHLPLPSPSFLVSLYPYHAHSDEIEARLVLCEATRLVLSKCFDLLGIQKVDRI